MAHRSAAHNSAWKAYGAVSAPPLRSGPENPDPAEIAMVSKYVLRYGRKGDGPPKIHRQLWRDALLGFDEGRRKTHLREAAEHYGCDENDNQGGLYAGGG